ncbi:MAG: hypothetical protein J5I90_04430 [Caldilineales bacterium]|nr:hypothetical protein [Caldilineales bacterium]
MSTTAWVIIFGLVGLAAFLGWQWRRNAIARRQEWQRALLADERADEKARENERLSSYLDAVRHAGGNAIFLVDGDRVVQWMNDSASALCVDGASPPIHLSKAIRSYEILDLADRAVKSPGPHERQFQRDERDYYGLVQVVNPDPLLMAVRVRDVTELQRLGRARRDFVANISHDLRTPITAIQIMVETLQAGVESQKRRKSLLDGILDQTSTLQQLAQEMLDLSLIESGRMPLKLIEIPVQELIEPVATSMQTQVANRELRLRSEFDPSLRALADPENIRRVLQNLVHNAIKFSEPGQEIVMGAQAEGQDICMFVRDSGRGIDSAELERIFERFYKGDRMRTDVGTGLGLSIARHIVEGHGGRIWAESELGRGATFFFTIPRA